MKRMYEITAAEIAKVSAFYITNAVAAEPETADTSSAIAILGYIAASFDNGVLPYTPCAAAITLQHAAAYLAA